MDYSEKVVVGEVTSTMENNISDKILNNNSQDILDNDVDHSDNELLINEEEDSDNIDEESLKQIEINLTKEQLQDRLEKALSYKEKGNCLFNQRKYLDSLNLYTEGLKLCPLSCTSDRATLYANRGVCKDKMGRKESALEDCTKALECNDKYFKVYLRRALLYEDADKLEESFEDYKKALELNPTDVVALEGVRSLPIKINEKNEKLKEEMLSKLKDLGNTVLKPFGLSTDNFKLTQDPNTGGYSINFSQNSK